MRTDDVLTADPARRKGCDAISDWPAWLAEGDDPEKPPVLRRHVEKGLPCGSEAFIQNLEKAAKRILRYRSRADPRNGMLSDVNKGCVSFFLHDGAWFQLGETAGRAERSGKNLYRGGI